MAKATKAAAKAVVEMIEVPVTTLDEIRANLDNLNAQFEELFDGSVAASPAGVDDGQGEGEAVAAQAADLQAGTWVYLSDVDEDGNITADTIAEVTEVGRNFVMVESPEYSDEDLEALNLTGGEWDSGKYTNADLTKFGAQITDSPYGDEPEEEPEETPPPARQSRGASKSAPAAKTSTKTAAKTAAKSAAPARGGRQSAPAPAGRGGAPARGRR
jgi:hypothetical protein